METLEEAAEHNYPGGDVWTEEQAVIRRLAFKNGAKWQAERMVTKEAYESTQVMIKASNEGFLSKINELKDQIERMYSEEDMLQALSLGFTSTDETWEQCVEFVKEHFKKK